MIKPILFSALAVSAVSAQAELYDYSITNKIYPTQVVEKTVVVKQPVALQAKANEHPLDVALSYRNDKAIGLEGMEATLQYQLNDKVVVGGNIFGNEDDVLSYGAYAGVPFKLTGHSIRIVPYVGLEQYTDNDQTGNEDKTAINTGFKTFTNVYKSVGITTDVKYVRGTEDKDDLNDVSYSIGLTNKF